MDGEMPADLPGLEREFWNRYMDLRALLDERRTQSECIVRIREEQAIPPQIRDAAVQAVEDHLAASRRVFGEMLACFIAGAAAGLSAVDIEVSATILSRTTRTIQSCLLLVEGRAEEIPADIGERLIACILADESVPIVEAIRRFYETEETRSDMLLPGRLDRCSLLILEELYPTSCHHVSIRLPASVLLDRQIDL